MQSKIKLISYWLYLWSVLSVAGVVFSSSILELVAAVIFAGLFYQAGTGLMKRRNRDRKIAIGVLSLLALLNLDTVTSVVGSSSFNSQILLVLSISALVLIVSAVAAFYLLNREVAQNFNQSTEPNK